MNKAFNKGGIGGYNFGGKKETSRNEDFGNNATDEKKLADAGA